MLSLLAFSALPATLLAQSDANVLPPMSSTESVCRSTLGSSYTGRAATADDGSATWCASGSQVIFGDFPPKEIPYSYLPKGSQELHSRTPTSLESLHFECRALSLKNGSRIHRSVTCAFLEREKWKSHYT